MSFERSLSVNCPFAVLFMRAGEEGNRGAVSLMTGERTSVLQIGYLFVGGELTCVYTHTCTPLLEGKQHVLCSATGLWRSSLLYGGSGRTGSYESHLMKAHGHWTLWPVNPAQPPESPAWGQSTFRLVFTYLLVSHTHYIVSSHL